MGKFYVYMWRNTVNGKCYVGKGQGKRYKHHRYLCSDSLLSRAFRKHGRDKFECRFLATDLEDALALDLERQVINLLDCQVPRGYNITSGGQGTAGFRWSDESIEKRKAAKRSPSAETRAKISASLQGHQVTPETKERVAAALRGRTVPADVRARTAETMRQVRANTPKDVAAERMRKAWETRRTRKEKEAQ